MPSVLVMRWVVWIRTLGLGLQYGAGGRGSGGGLGVVGPAGMMAKDEDQEGCALIGLGAKVGDNHRETSYHHWGVPKGFETGIFSWRGEENLDTQSDGQGWSTGWIR